MDGQNVRVNDSEHDYKLDSYFDAGVRTDFWHHNHGKIKIRIIPREMAGNQEESPHNRV